MDDDHLARGAHLIAHELRKATDLLVMLAAVGIRDTSAEGWFDAVWLHERCLIGFLCVDRDGRRRPSDMKPSDFIGGPWALPADDLCRELRGRLPIIKKQMAHLAWDAVTDESMVSWSAVFVAHQIAYALGLVVADLDVSGSSHRILAEAHRCALDTLPAWDDRHPQTPVDPAPPRTAPS